MKRDLTAAYVRSLLHYDPYTGVIIWRERPRECFHDERIWKAWNTRYAGTSERSPNRDGYIDIVINRRLFKAHRLAWLWMTGEWPKYLIDHINGDRSDNRFHNLREATHAENMWNLRKPSTNTSGIKGVSKFKRNGKWRARISANGTSRFLGYFDKRDDAIAAHAKAANELHGEFARTE
jgi:hypothetical protein